MNKWLSNLGNEKTFSVTGHISSANELNSAKHRHWNLIFYIVSTMLGPKLGMVLALTN